MNPCTLGWYLPILGGDVPSGGGPGGGGGSAGRWAELDGAFRRELPDAAWVGRLAYRGLVMRACPRVRVVDGVGVSGREREKAERLLEGVMG